MRFAVMLLTLLMCPITQAFASCKVNTYLKSSEGREKLSSLVERSKGLIFSKLEELSIEEGQVQVKAIYPKTAKDFQASLSVVIKSKSLHVEGTSFIFSKVIRDENCGVEITISGGRLHNKESGKDFGSLGRVKEFVRLN
jgi:hypothetical protein